MSGVSSIVSGLLLMYPKGGLRLRDAYERLGLGSLALILLGADLAGKTFIKGRIIIKIEFIKTSGLSFPFLFRVMIVGNGG